MSRPVRDRLTDLAADVEQVRLAPAADVRARGRSRARRHRAGTATALAVAAGFGVSTLADRDRPPAATTPAAPPASCVPADLSLPGDLGSVVINVFGDPGPVTGQLDRRGFSATARPGPGGNSSTGGATAVLRYGPRAIGNATVLRAFVDGDAVMQFEPARPDRTVDLVLDADFPGLASATKVNQNLVAAGEPTRPPGSC